MEEPEIPDPFSNPDKPISITFDEITSAAYRIKSGIRNTECSYSEHLSNLTGVEIYVKKEFLQATGSFKERGARKFKTVAMDISSDFLNIFQISWIFLIIIVIGMFYILYNTYDHQSLLKLSGSVEESKVYKKAALSSTSQLCEEFVINVFRKGGSVADAAIVSLLVQGLTSPQSLGVGGGFIMVYYDRKSKQVHVLNAREYSPSNVTKNMFKKSPSPSWGGLSSAIPGEIYGYWELHQRFGKLPWKSLFDPVIKLCKEGVPVTRITSEMLMKMRTQIMTSASIKEILCNPKTGDVYKPGEFMKRPALAKTFEVLATEGAKALYDGSLTKEFVEDIKNNGGIITEEDMKNYRAKWMSPISMSMMNNKHIYTTPNPGCGQIFLAILDVIFSLRKSDSPSVNWFRIVETWKYAFGYKSNMDGPNLSDDVKGENYDPNMAKTILKNIESETSTSSDVRDYAEDFEKMGHEGGTCHINLLSPNGDAVSVTSSINYAIGALYCSESTGIIMNNHMMDFSIPEYMDKFYSANQLAPSKQPVSSMVPTIIVDTKTHNVAMVVGAAGGFKILTAATQMLIEMLVFDIPQELAIAHRRLHHQLVPMILFYEEDFPKTILDELKKYGHHLERIQPGTGVAVITVNKRGIRATGDPRRLGSASGY